MLMVLKCFSLTLQLCVIRLIYVNSVNSVNSVNVQMLSGGDVPLGSWWGGCRH